MSMIDYLRGDREIKKHNPEDKRMVGTKIESHEYKVEELK